MLCIINDARSLIVIFSKTSRHFVSFNSSLQQLDEATNNPKNAQELKKSLSEVILTKEKLSPEQILANDLANISVKTENTKTNQVSLDISQLTQMER